MESDRAGSLWARWTDALRELFWPANAKCLHCQTLFGADRDWLCEDCRRQMIPLAKTYTRWCDRCGRPLAKDETCRECAEWPADGVSMARYAYVYAPPASSIVRVMKYHGAKRVCAFLGDEIARMLRAQKIDGFDMIASVPIHRRRAIRRGYNQAEWIARRVAAHMRVPYMDALSRVRNTPQQARLSGAARKNNLEGAFAATDIARGKRVLLVDDVLTSGATMNGCAQALNAVGAMDVVGAAFCGPGAKNKK